MALRIFVDYAGETYKSAPIEGETFESLCEGFDLTIKNLAYLKMRLDGGGMLYLAEQAATRAAITIVEDGKHG